MQALDAETMHRQGDVGDYLVESRDVAFQFLVFTTMVHLRTYIAHSPVPLTSEIERFSHALHDQIATLWRMLVGELADAELLHVLIGEAIRTFEWIYPEPDDTRDPMRFYGPFSAIRLPELVNLARRNEATLHKYGASQAARVFEHQLALILQSFGALVVQTRPGDRSVDLLCITAEPVEPYSFLVEAKSSKRPYGLPSKDERALAEYIAASRRLTTLPPLKLVLLVGDTPAKALSGRLRNLEVKLGIPIRFLSAELLAYLRDELSGPLIFHDFLDLVAAEPWVVSRKFPSRVVARRLEQQTAHERVVRSMIPIQTGARFLAPRSVTPRL